VEFVYSKARATRGSWNSRINSETLGVRMETVCPSISQSSPNAEMSWEVWGGVASSIKGEGDQARE